MSGRLRGDERIGWRRVLAIGASFVMAIGAFGLDIDRREPTLVLLEARKLAPGAADGAIRLVNAHAPSRPRGQGGRVAGSVWCGSIDGRENSAFAIAFRRSALPLESGVTDVARSWIDDRSADQEALLRLCALLS